MVSKKGKTRKKTIYSTFTEYLYRLNNSKFFAGVIMLVMNIGSKYITLQLSKSQEDYIRYTIGRQVLVFAILWMGTRDIVVALILTCVFIIFADYLLNDTSKFCIINDKCKTTMEKNNNPKDAIVTQKDINDAIHILKKARKKKFPNEMSQVEDQFIVNGLYKENFI